MRLEVIEKIPEGDSLKTPVLFVHGAWHGAWCWDEYFLPYFAEQGYPAYALSVRGHGLSEKQGKSNSFRISDYVSDVAEVAAQLPNPPVLVGHSMGGLIVQKYLEKYSAPAAILMASLPVGGLAGSAVRMAINHPWLFLKANLTANMNFFISSTDLVRDSFFPEDMDKEVQKKYFSLLQAESYLAFLDMILLNLPRPDRITTPLLVLGAAKDRMISPKEVERTARAYHAQSKIFDNMAHDMMLEKGWQTVADTIIDWISGKNLSDFIYENS